MNSKTHFSLVSTTLLVCLLGSAPPAHAQQPSWSPTGSLGTPRSGHIATLLANGKVLVVGGGSAGTADSAELYDPETSQWRATGSLNWLRGAHVAVRLTDGKVLVTGGGTAEIFDPEKDSWRAIPPGDFSGGSDGTATLLADGRVLIAGGSPNGTIAKLYDPATSAWSPAGAMNAPRFLHSATLLPDGKVLIVGGANAPRSAELYDPTTGSWTVTGDLVTPRVWNHDASLLPNGKILVVGGGVSSDDYCNEEDNAELYDPETGQWSPTGRPILPRNDNYEYNSATLLPNGKVLQVGGCFLNSAELYDPVTGTWSVTTSLNVPRSGHTVTLLASGKVLVAGGSYFNNSAELFDTGTPTIINVSAASFSTDRTLAPESIASAFGKNLAITAQTADSMPRPTVPAGVTVVVRDRIGVERLAHLLYVSPELINYVVPPGNAVGLATVTVTSGGSFVAAGLVEIARVAPGLFTASSTGRGLAAGFWTRVAEGGAQRVDNLRESVPVDLGAPGDQLFLSLYGTGFRGGASAMATVGGAGVPVFTFGAVADYQGLDVVTIGPLPRTLIGRGEVDLAFSVDGKAANLVKVNIH